MDASDVGLISAATREIKRLASALSRADAAAKRGHVATLRGVVSQDAAWLVETAALYREVAPREELSVLGPRRRPLYESLAGAPVDTTTREVTAIADELAEGLRNEIDSGD